MPNKRVQKHQSANLVLKTENGVGPADPCLPELGGVHFSDKYLKKKKTKNGKNLFGSRFQSRRWLVLFSWAEKWWRTMEGGYPRPGNQDAEIRKMGPRKR